MNRKKVSIVVATVIAGALSVCGNVWAQTIFIPMAGSESVTTADPGVVWTDEDGITHIRGMIRTGISIGQDADGIPIVSESVYHSNMNINMATGEGDYSGSAVITGHYGDLVGSAQGRLEATISAGVLNGNFNYPRGSGEWEGYQLRGTFVSVLGTDFSNWEGVIFLPGGEKADGAPGTDSRTLSSVKALYR